MKRFFLGVTAIAAMLSLSGCEYLDQMLQLADDASKIVGGTYTDKWANLVNETKYDAKVEGNTLIYGNHTYTINTEIDVDSKEFNRATASVSFSHIPSGYTEFEAVYNNLLGKSIAGTAAMIPMAMEIYARNTATGEKCIKLLCTSGAASDMITGVKGKVIPSTTTGNDGYIERFISAALLKGAKPSNAYAPDYPYTVEMAMTSNGVKESAQAGGTDIYMSIITSGGWSSAARGVEIFQATGSSMYKVYGCPGCYAQCAAISGTWAGLR